MLSLLMTMVRVNDLYDNFRREQEAVAELVKIGNLQREQKEYAASWQSYQEALELDPGNSAARNERVELALQWLRNIRVMGGEETFTDIAEQLFPVLYRGVALSEGKRAADLIAHLGWASYLKSREGRAPREQAKEYFEWAISVDERNAYAHAMYGFWKLFTGGELENAVENFNIATVNAGAQVKSEVRHLHLWALLNRNDPEFDKALLQFANEMCQNNESIDQRTRIRILQLYERNWKSARWKAIQDYLTPKEHLATLNFLTQDIDFPEFKTRIFNLIRGRLEAAQNNKTAALEILQPLLKTLQAQGHYNLLIPEIESLIQEIENVN